MVGTAEYIELSLPELAEAGAKYVTFTANAYSCGALSPNLVVGWMDSAYPMKVSEKREWPTTHRVCSTWYVSARATFHVACVRSS